jgi:Zn-dependent peptidase ImmA (M78 family)/transcriptional regulator with XRE-family HTH domain/predicted secreted protein
MPANKQSDKSTLSARLKEAREYLGLSQEEVARVLRIPRTAVSLIENGERNVSALELKQLADVYQRPLGFFTGDSTQEPSVPSDVAHLARTASKLTPSDREELIRFAQFLEAKRKEYKGTMSFREDLLIGAKAAAELHAKLGIRHQIESTSSSVDVFATIRRLRSALLFKKLDGILGAYVPAKTPGIMITTQRPLPIQRFTGGHELGHFFMRHEPSFDGEEILNFTKETVSMEAQANGFAAEFLMPRWLLNFHARRHGWNRDSVQKPETVYQLSLRLGTSYAATCLSLKNHGILDSGKADELLQIPPKSIKQSLLPNLKPENWFLDIWVLTDKDRGAAVQGEKGDLFLLRLDEMPGAGYLWDVEDLQNQGFAILNNTQSETDEEVGGPIVREVMASVTSPLKGKMAMRLGRPWEQPDHPAAGQFELAFDLQGKEQPGISRAQRLELEEAK